MNPDLIFDVGLHKGEDSELYLKKGYRVVAVEANPRLCEIAQKRLDRFVESGQLVIVNAAITEQEGPARFFVNRQVSVWGTTSPAWVARNERLGTSSYEITIAGITFRQLLERFGMPYYLKVDIEGADLLCLEALRHFADRPKFVSIESNKTSWDALLAEFDLFKSLGYGRFKVVDQSRVADQHSPNPPREGRFAAHRFPSGSSGLFGDEAPGEWMTEAEALRWYRAIFVAYRYFGNDGLYRDVAAEHVQLPLGWYDTHATY